MIRALLVLLVACSSERAPQKQQGFGVVATVGNATMLTNGERVALRDGARWFDIENGKLVENLALGAAVARESEALGTPDVHLGATPIVVGGEHHQEKHVRVPSRDLVPLDGIATEIVVAGDREAWRYEHELVSTLAFVRGAIVEPIAPIALAGGEVEQPSPVSQRRCKHPRVADLDVARDTVYALVVECTGHTRVIAYPGAVETRVEPADALAVSRTGEIRTVAAAAVPGATRVLQAVFADDGALWVLATTATNTIVARDGAPMPVTQPRQLARDATLGVVVLAGDKLYAERR